MVKYRNEAAFSRALCAHLTDLGHFVQRIETRETGRGVPDLYVGTPSGCYWIELKRIKTMGRKPYHEISWRPGQQRWMYQHWRKTNVPCFTFVAYDNMIVVIPMTKLYRGNIVPYTDIMKIWVRMEDVRL